MTLARQSLWAVVERTSSLGGHKREAVLSRVGGAEACEGRVHIFWKIEGKVTGMKLELVIQVNARRTVWVTEYVAQRQWQEGIWKAKCTHDGVFSPP